MVVISLSYDIYFSNALLFPEEVAFVFSLVATFSFIGNSLNEIPIASYCALLLRSEVF